MARPRKPKKRHGARPIRTEHDLQALTLEQKQARHDALQALGLMRERGYSRARAAREVGRRPEVVQAWLGPTLVKQGHRFIARKRDHLVRMMKVLTTKGEKTVPIDDSRTASRVGSHHAAVGLALRGNLAPLKALRGQSIHSGNDTYPLITNLNTLKRLALAGELPEYEIYDLTLDHRS